MANIIDLVLVPCQENPSLTAVNAPNSAIVFRAPAPIPLNLSSGSAIPVGPQRWPL